ncbi:unnamed protein product [Urochloa humidicola]
MAGPHPTALTLAFSGDAAGESHCKDGAASLVALLSPPLQGKQEASRAPTNGDPREVVGIRFAPSEACRRSAATPSGYPSTADSTAATTCAPSPSPIAAAAVRTPTFALRICPINSRQKITYEFKQASIKKHDN